MSTSFRRADGRVLDLKSLPPISPRRVSIPADEAPMRVDAHGQVAGEKGERIVGLDGLRGIAAFGVLLYHFTTRYPDFGSFVSPPPFTFPEGKFGVHLFFIISGFVIFRTVECAKRPLDFVKSRFVRLYPAFWLSLLIVFGTLAVRPRDRGCQ